MTEQMIDLASEQMSQKLHELAGEIFTRCSTISRRGLAHAFCDLAGHVELLCSDVKAVDSFYELENHSASLAKIRIFLSGNEYCTPEFQEQAFNENVEKMKSYIAYLDQIIAKGEIVHLKQAEALAS